MSAIKTAVFPVAGMGTRFLPATKSSPKEMLPVLDRPLIQYVVDEAIAAGVKRLVFVTSYTKRALEDYFDSNFELETRLEQRHKLQQLELVRNLIPDDVNVIYVRQKAPLGLGHAILCAEEVVGNQPFAVLLADDIIDGPQPCLAQMVTSFARSRQSTLAVEQVPKQLTQQYGVVALRPGTEQIEQIVEKPAPAEAPSDLAVIGRYILTPAIFAHLRAIQPGAGGELQLTDAIARLLQYEDIKSFKINGIRYDCGSRRGWLKATVAYAMKDPELRRALFDMLQPYSAKDLEIS